MTTSISILASDFALNTTSVTAGRNGYPSSVYETLTGFDSYAEAEATAQEIGGKVVLLHKKDGWDLYESAGDLFAAPVRKAEDEGDDYLIIASEADMNEFIASTEDSLADAEDGERAVIEDDLATIKVAFNSLAEGKALLLKSNGDYTHSYERVELYPVEWHDTDNNSYIVAVELN